MADAARRPARSRVPATALLLAVLATGCAGAAPLERTVNNLLGTTCTIRLYSGGSAAALDQAFARIAQIEDRMTVNREDSEVIRVMDEKASTVFLGKPGMGLDLGSIAKGYAADEAARVLKAAGVNAALVDLGGNILTLGTKPDGSRWRIGIQNPFEARGTRLGVVETSGGSVTTAGTYERLFERDGTRYFHILDARTGYRV